MSSKAENINSESPLKYSHRLSSLQLCSDSAEIFNGDVEFALVIK